MIHRLRRVSEACRKLKQYASEFVCLHQRQYAGLELFNFGRRPIPLLVGELLPGLDGELEIIRSAPHPAFGGFGMAGTVKRGIDFDSVKVSRIKLQFVGLRQRIEHAGPGSRAGLWRITPSTCTDSPDACIILRFDEEITGHRLAALLPGRLVYRVHPAYPSRRGIAQVAQPRNDCINGAESQ